LADQVHECNSGAAAPYLQVIARRWFTRSDKPGDANIVKGFAELGPAELAKQRLVTAAFPALLLLEVE
jgi:hypothetical protein